MEKWANLGRVRPVPQGTWSSALSYKLLDVVVSENGMGCYIARKDVPAGTALDDDSYWMPMMDAGVVSQIADRATNAATEAENIVNSKADSLTLTTSENRSGILPFTETSATPRHTITLPDVWPDVESNLEPVLSIGPKFAGSGIPSPNNRRELQSSPSGATFSMFSGANLANTKFVHGTRSDDGELVVAASGSKLPCITYEDLVPVMPGMKVYASSELNAFASVRYYFYDWQKNLISTETGANLTVGLIAPEGACWFALQKSNFGDYSDYVGKAVMVSDSPIEKFEAYAGGETHVIDFGAEGYGGVADWNAGTFTPNAFMELDGSETYGSGPASGGSADLVIWLGGVSEMKRGDAMPGWCSHFFNDRGRKNRDTVRFGANTQTIYFYVRKSRFADADAFKAWVAEQKGLGTPVQLVFPASSGAASVDLPQLTARSGMNKLCAGAEDIKIAYNKSLHRAVDELEADTYSGIDRLTENQTKACKRFAELIANSSGNADSFLFFTDPHLVTKEVEGDLYPNFSDALKQIAAVYNNTPTSMCICGGDWLNKWNTRNNAAWCLGRIYGAMKRRFDEYVLVVGNHDTNYLGYSYANSGWDDNVYDESAISGDMLSHAAIRNLWHRDHEASFFSRNMGTAQMYVFDSGLDWDPAMDEYRWEQIDWFANRLIAEDTANSFGVVHIAYENGITQLAENIAAVANAYNNRTEITVNDKTYDFTGTAGAFRFIISGHWHTDLTTSINGIPIVVTRDLGQQNAYTFDLMHADYSAGMLNIVRIGIGEDRTIAMATGVLNGSPRKPSSLVVDADGNATI